jgi:hypothetical protein
MHAWVDAKACLPARLKDLSVLCSALLLLLYGSHICTALHRTALRSFLLSDWLFWCVTVFVFVLFNHQPSIIDQSSLLSAA